MRIIQYPMTLRQGYCLFNCPDADNSESYGNPAYPGIRMKVIERLAEQDIIDLFRLTSDTDNSELKEHFRQTLRGEETLWKIVRVVINNRHIAIQLASKQRQDEIARLIAETEFDDISKMSGDEERAFFDSLTGDMGEVSLDITSIWATLQFEVPHPDGSDTDIIEVKLEGRSGVTITENDCYKKRKFEIQPPVDKLDLFNSYAIVTEYM